MALKKTTVNLDPKLIAWHESRFPDISMSASLNHLLSAYQAEIEKEPPVDYYKLAAKHVRDFIDRDLENGNDSS